VDTKNHATLVAHSHPLKTLNFFWSTHVLDHLDRMPSVPNEPLRTGIHLHQLRIRLVANTFPRQPFGDCRNPFLLTNMESRPRAASRVVLVAPSVLFREPLDPLDPQCV
jgi:hypothetical protein